MSRLELVDVCISGVRWADTSIFGRIFTTTGPESSESGQ